MIMLTELLRRHTPSAAAEIDYFRYFIMMPLPLLPY